VYVPVPGDNLETIYPVATPLGPYAPQAGPAHVVRFAAPVASGVLPDVNFSRGTGEQTIAAAGTFAGDYLTFSVETALPGVSIDRGTGIVTVSTETEINGDVAVIASNSGGAAEVSFNLSITSAATVPAQMPAPTVTATGQDSLRVDLAAAPDDGGSPITSYNLRFRTGDEAWTVRKGVSDPEVLSGLLANTEYEVRTAAVNTIGRGPWSGSGSANTEKDVLPAIMANADNTVDILVSDGTFTITVSGADQAHHNGTFGPFDTADLDSGPLMVVEPGASGAASFGATLTALPGLWIFPADDVATVTGEWISGGVSTGDTDTSYLTDSGDATSDVLYRETATNTAGARSADSNAITLPALPTAPAQMNAPTLTVAGSTTISVDLASAPSDGGSVITSYDLRYSTDETNWTVVSDVSDPEAVLGLNANTLYYVQTRAVNAMDANPNNWSASVSATTEEASTASVAEQLIAEWGSDLVSLLDMSDFSNLWQDREGTVPVTAAGQSFRRIDDLMGSGIFLRDNATPYPVAQDGYADYSNAILFYQSTNSYTSGMAAIALIEPGTDNTWTLVGKLGGAAHATGTAQIDMDTDPNGGFLGTLTHAVDNVDLVAPTRDDLYEAMTAGGGWKVQSVRGLDLSAENSLAPLAYTGGIRFRGKVKFFMLVKNFTAPKLAATQTILEAAKP
jgi:hypothetical protein